MLDLVLNGQYSESASSPGSTFSNYFVVFYLKTDQLGCDQACLTG